MSISSILLLFCSLLLLLGCSQAPVRSVAPPLAEKVILAPGLAIRPPLHWQPQVVKGNPLPVLVSPTGTIFLFIYTDESPLALREYTDQQIAATAMALPKFQVISQKELESDGEARGISVIADSQWFKQSVRQAYYFLEIGIKKQILLCESLVTTWETEGSACLESFRTVDINL